MPQLVALIPAAGHARRLPGIEGSKEILPLGTAPDGRGGTRPRAVCEHLLEALAEAKIERGLMILRPGKEDIPAFLESLPQPPLELEFPVVPATPSVAHTLDAVHDRLAGRRVVLGYPDILISPASAWGAVRARQEASGADLVLGLFPTRHPERADMVELDAAGRPRRLWIKQPDRGLAYTWSIALWTPVFTELLHAEVARWDREAARGRPELQVGAILQTALDRGLHVEAVPFPDGDSFDVGEPAALRQARHRLEAEEED